MILEFLAEISITSFLLCLLCGLLVYWWWTSKPDPPGIPPGPRGLINTLKGLAWLLIYKESPELSADRTIDKYGPIYSFYIGNQLGILLSDYENIRKAFVDHGETFSGRNSDIGFRQDEGDKKSILSTDGPMWKEHRRFTLTTLRNFGIGKASIEPRIIDEISCLLKDIEAQNSEGFDITELLALSIFNNICLLEFGRRYNYTDEKFLTLRKTFNDLKKLGILPHLKIIIPRLRHIPGIDTLLKIDQFKRMWKVMDDFVNDEIAEHYKNYSPGSCDDYIDAYFTERALREKENRNPEIFDDVALLVNLQLFFIAGTETTLTTLRWMFLYLINHPDIQRKIQKEIDNVIGRERMPSYDDRPSMPFTEATIFETHRIASIVPLNVPHRTIEDVQLKGFNIPKDTVVSSYLYGVHRNPALFPDPSTFRPERFINEEGVAVKPDWLIPFSMGKRFCLGEPLARMELFLYLTCILQKFTLTNVEGEVLTDEMIVFTRELKPYNTRFILRE